MERLQFDHIHLDKMFTFANNFDPEKVIDKIKSKVDKLANYYNLDVTYGRKIYTEVDIKHTDIYCVLLINFKNSELNLDLSFDINIPDIKNSFCRISGVRRYVQKQIRDIMYVSLKSKNKEKLICEFDKPFIISKYSKRKDSESVYNFNIHQQNFMNAIGVYMYLENGENKFEKIDDPIVRKNIEIFKDLSKDEILKKISPLISIKQKRRSIDYVNVYYELSDILNKYFDSPADIIYNLFLHIEDVDDSQGLDITNRRVRDVFEMVYTLVVSKIIDYVNETVNILNKTRRTGNFHIEPFQYLYDFVLVENMFEAPLASVSNISRCTIVGDGGFAKDSVPVYVKNLHPSQYNCIDPAVTPDRDKAGVVLYLASTCELDEIGRFKIDEGYAKYFNSWR